MDNLKVSIFTPTSDSRFLRQAYDSIRDQPFFEWIVVFNNGAEPVQFDDPRVKCFTLPEPVELIGYWKACACDRASGDILLELDSDDLLLSGAVEEVIIAFSDPSVGFVYSNHVPVWAHPETGEIECGTTWDPALGWKMREFEWQGHKLRELVAFPPTPDAAPHVYWGPEHLRAFRRDLYELVGGFNRGMKVTEDRDLVCKLFQVTRFKHIDKPLYLYRKHGANSVCRWSADIQTSSIEIYDRYTEPCVTAWCRREALPVVSIGAASNDPEIRTMAIRDIDTRWPFEDSSVGCVRAFGVLQHAADPIHAMKELYRVLVPGGWAFIQVPSTDGRAAFQDPTFKSFWNENSFSYFTNQLCAQDIGTPARFQAHRLYTTDLNTCRNCWTYANLVSLKDGYRPPGLVTI